MSVSRPAAGLENRSLIGFFWIFSGSGALAAVKILVVAVLARILTPADFGIVGAAMVVATLGEVFARIGVAPTIVQCRHLTETHIQTGFILSIVFGIATGGVVWFSAPLVASLFQISNLAPVVQVMALLFPIRSVSVVAEGLIQRHMRYRDMAVMEFISYLVGYAPSAIIMALSGYGFWSLVVGQIIQTVVLSIGLVAMSRHTMRPRFDGTIALEIARFGFGATLARLGNYIAMNADYFIVGRWLGPAALGIYTRAFYFVEQPTNLIGAVADKVLFPAMASIQDKHERCNRAYVKATGIIALVSFPVCAFLIAMAPDIVLILLGPKWEAAILPFQILLLSLPFRTAYKLTSTFLRAVGFVYVLALWQWIYAGSVVVCAIAGAIFGINGVACGVAAAIILNFWIGLVFAGIARQIRVAPILSVIMRHLGISVLVLLIAMLVQYFGARYDVPAFVTVFLGAAASGCVMLVMWLCVPRAFGEEGQWLFGKADSSYRKVLSLAGRL